MSQADGRRESQGRMGVHTKRKAACVGRAGAGGRGGALTHSENGAGFRE
jgi:hypothetical protein